MYIPDLEYQKILEFLPIVCVDLVITHNDKCLLLLRNTEPAKGQYWFPGGRINKMETIIDAAIRKSKEETNLDCQFVKILSVEETIFPKKENMKIDLHTINICCHLTSDNIENLHIDKYHDNYKWTAEEVYHDAVNHAISLMNFKKNKNK